MAPVNPVPVQPVATISTHNQQNDIHFLQIQEAFSKQYRLNEKFDERIGYLESTTDRIDANVDQLFKQITMIWRLHALWLWGLSHPP